MICTNFSMLGTNSSIINTRFSIPKIVLVLVQSRSNHTSTNTIFGILNLVLIMLELVPSMLKLVQIILKLAYQQQYQYQYEIGTVQSEHWNKQINAHEQIWLVMQREGDTLVYKIFQITSIIRCYSENGRSHSCFLLYLCRIDERMGFFRIIVLEAQYSIGTSKVIVSFRFDEVEKTNLAIYTQRCASA